MFVIFRTDVVVEALIESVSIDEYEYENESISYSYSLSFLQKM